MFSPAAFTFLVVTVLELFVLVQLAGAIGTVNAVLVVLAVSLVGMFLVRTRGAGFVNRTFQRLAADQAAGVSGAGSSASKQSSRDQLAHSFLEVIGAVLLVIPGLVTAAFGVVLMVRPARALLVPVVRNRIPDVSKQSFGAQMPFGSPFGGSTNRRGDVIDVDGHQTDDSSSPTSNPSRTTRPELY